MRNTTSYKSYKLNHFLKLPLLFTDNITLEYEQNMNKE